MTESGRYANLAGLDSRILFECRAPKGSFDWVELGNVISERVFFKVDGDWYVDDAREADGAKAKRRERARRDFYRNASPRHSTPPRRSSTSGFARCTDGRTSSPPMSS